MRTAEPDALPVVETKSAPGSGVKGKNPEIQNARARMGVHGFTARASRRPSLGAGGRR